MITGCEEILSQRVCPGRVISTRMSTQAASSMPCSIWLSALEDSAQGLCPAIEPRYFGNRLNGPCASGNLTFLWLVRAHRSCHPVSADLRNICMLVAEAGMSSRGGSVLLWRAGRAAGLAEGSRRVFWTGRLAVSACMNLAAATTPRLRDRSRRSGLGVVWGESRCGVAKFETHPRPPVI